MNGKTYQMAVSNMCHIFLKFVVRELFICCRYNHTYFVPASGHSNPIYWAEISPNGFGIKCVSIFKDFNIRTISRIDLQIELSTYSK